jgi:mRNA-degrading endonuclease RelE of RelBE toxin-antitoxin system
MAAPHGHRMGCRPTPKGRSGRGQSARIDPRERAPGLDEIAADPFARHADVKRYKEGGPDSFRLRHDQWRVICRIDRKAQQVQVQIIDTRGSVYR